MLTRPHQISVLKAQLRQGAAFQAELPQMVARPLAAQSQSHMREGSSYQAAIPALVTGPRHKPSTKPQMRQGAAFQAELPQMVARPSATQKGSIARPQLRGDLEFQAALPGLQQPPSATQGKSGLRPEAREGPELQAALPGLVSRPSAPQGKSASRPEAQEGAEAQVVLPGLERQPSASQGKSALRPEAREGAEVQPKLPGSMGRPSASKQTTLAREQDESSYPPSQPEVPTGSTAPQKEPLPAQQPREGAGFQAELPGLMLVPSAPKQKAMSREQDKSSSPLSQPQVPTRLVAPQEGALSTQQTRQGPDFQAELPGLVNQPPQSLQQPCPQLQQISAAGAALPDREAQPRKRGRPPAMNTIREGGEYQAAIPPMVARPPAPEEESVRWQAGPSFEEAMASAEGPEVVAAEDIPIYCRCDVWDAKKLGRGKHKLC